MHLPKATSSSLHRLSEQTRILDCVLRKSNGGTWIRQNASIRQSIAELSILLILYGYISALNNNWIS